MEIEVIYSTSGKYGLTKKGQKMQVDAEYAHAMIANGSAKEVVNKKPQENKQTKPKNNKSK